jgi:hypothetical protein
MSAVAATERPPTEHCRCFVRWFIGMAVQPATNHITLVSDPTSSAAGTAWLSSRGAYEHRAHQIWALFAQTLYPALTTHESRQRSLGLAPLGAGGSVPAYVRAFGFTPFTVHQQRIGARSHVPTSVRRGPIYGIWCTELTSDISLCPPGGARGSVGAHKSAPNSQLATVPPGGVPRATPCSSSYTAALNSVHYVVCYAWHVGASAFSILELMPRRMPLQPDVRPQCTRRRRTCVPLESRRNRPVRESGQRPGDSAVSSFRRNPAPQRKSSTCHLDLAQPSRHMCVTAWSSFCSRSTTDA